MAYELVYTSVPRGLEPGRTGFCTVAMTRGMAPQLVKMLENLVVYKPVFMHYDANRAFNPPSIFHYPISDGKRQYELLARVSACGLDYTKRSNKIGHFLLVSEAERTMMSAGPASLLGESNLFISEWKGEPQFFQSERTLPFSNPMSAKAHGWAQMTGDAGWAAWLAEQYLENPGKPCFVLFDPLRHTHLEQLVRESLMLLPPEKRWRVTWNTYLTALPPGISCNWRFCVNDPESLRNIGCVAGATILDLRQQLGSAGNGHLAQCARTGLEPYPQKNPVRVKAGGQADGDLPLRLNGQKGVQSEGTPGAREKKSYRLKSEPDNVVPAGFSGGMGTSMPAQSPYPAVQNDGARMKMVVMGSVIALLVLAILGLLVMLLKGRASSEDEQVSIDMESEITAPISSSGTKSSKDSTDGWANAMKNAKDVDRPTQQQPDDTNTGKGGAIEASSSTATPEGSDSPEQIGVSIPSEPEPDKSAKLLQENTPQSEEQQGNANNVTKGFRKDELEKEMQQILKQLMKIDQECSSLIQQIKAGENQLAADRKKLEEKRSKLASTNLRNKRKKELENEIKKIEQRIDSRNTFMKEDKAKLSRIKKEGNYDWLLQKYKELENEYNLLKDKRNNQ